MRPRTTAGAAVCSRDRAIGAEARRVDGRAGEIGERDRFDRLLIGVGVAREGHQLGDEVGELVHLEADALGDLAALVVVEALGAGEQLGVGLQARQRGAQLVARVGDEPLLAGAAVGERVDHRREAGGQAADLARAALGDLGVELAGLGDALGGVAQAGDRSDEPHGQEPAEDRGEHDAAERVEREAEPERVEDVVQLVETAPESQHRAVGPGDGDHPVAGARR